MTKVQRGWELLLNALHHEAAKPDVLDILMAKRRAITQHEPVRRNGRWLKPDTADPEVTNAVWVEGELRSVWIKSDPDTANYIRQALGREYVEVSDDGRTMRIDERVYGTRKASVMGVPSG